MLERARTGLDTQSKMLAKRIGTHVGLLGFVEQKIGPPDGVGDTARP